MQELVPRPAENGVVKHNCVFCTCVSKPFYCFFHTGMEPQVRTIIVWLRPHRGVGGEKEGVDIVFVEVLKCCKIPSRCVPVQEQDVRETSLAMTLWEVPHKFDAVIIKDILCHAAVRCNANGKSKGVLVLGEVLGPRIRVCQAREEAFWYIYFVVCAVCFLLFTNTPFLLFTSIRLVAVHNGWRARTLYPILHG